MTQAYEVLRERLVANPAKWLVTGAAGFIGSNLVEHLLKLRQRVTGFDNFSTGRRKNLEQVQAQVGAEAWSRFNMIEADLRDPKACQQACKVDYVLHQGALGSVPRSMEDPLSSHESNVTGFLNILLAARDAKVNGFVYASSSSVYGDEPTLPKVEHRKGNVLSPYAATKEMNELYAQVFARAYGMKTIGLRYFNVFGPRQDPEGAYAAVIPKWIAAMLKGETVYINGDGGTSRDFCFIENVVQANLLAAATTSPQATNQAYNVAVGERITLNELYRALQDNLGRVRPTLILRDPVHRDFRAGDVRHSLADTSKAKSLLGYHPTHTVRQGLELAMAWYCENVS